MKAGATRLDSRWSKAVLATVTLMIVLLAGALLRIAGLGERGLWLDEAITVRHATLPLYDVVMTQARGEHPPLYHILMHVWIAYFGPGEVALRAFSVLLGILSIPAAFWAGLRLYDRRTGLIAAGLIALSPFHIWYSQEARMYSLLFFFALLSSAFFALAVAENRSRWWIGYLFSTLGALFTHFFVVFLIAGQVAFYLAGRVLPAIAAARSNPGRAGPTRPWRVFSDVPTLGPWLACTVLLAALLGAWVANSVSLALEGGAGSTLLLPAVGGSGFGYGHEAPSLAARFSETATVVSQVVGGFHSTTTTEVLVALWPLLIYIGLLSLGTVPPPRGHTAALVAATAGMGLLLMLGQWHGQLLIARYFVATAAPLYLLAARMLSRIEHRAAPVFLAGLCALALVAWADQTYDPRNALHFEDREAVRHVGEQLRPGDRILYVPFFMQDVFEYYLPEGVEADGFPRSEQRNARQIVRRDLSDVVTDQERVWLFLWFQNIEQIRHDASLVSEWLEEKGFRLQSHEEFSGVEVLQFERRRHEPESFFVGSSEGEVAP